MTLPSVLGSDLFGPKGYYRRRQGYPYHRW